MSADFDFIVAGGGAGGCAAAGTLARAGASVVLLEPGPRPVPQADALDAVGRYYADAAMTAATGNCLLPVAFGRALGGTTAINSGTCLRPPADLVRSWSARAPSFDAEDYLSRVEEVWTALKVRRAPEKTMSASSALFLKGLAAVGVAGGRLERAEDGCEGRGRCCFVCPSGAKMTADRAFLDGAGVDVRLGWRVVEVRAGRPARVLVEGPDGRRWLRCRAVILACGALATPYFLRRLGLPAGDELTLHPAAKVFARFDRELEGWRGVPQGAGAEDPEEPRLRYEGVFTPPELAALTVPLEGRALKGWMDAFGRCAAFGYMIRDTSRGSVRYPAGPDKPVLRYRLNDEDLRLMKRGMVFTARTLLAAGAQEALLPLNGGPNRLRSRAEAESADLGWARAGNLQMMAFHPLGTAGLGRVVDGSLRAAEGVHVADGSVVPESLGVNPQVSIYAFGLYLARRLLHES